MKRSEIAADLKDEGNQAVREYLARKAMDFAKEKGDIIYKEGGRELEVEKIWIDLEVSPPVFVYEGPEVSRAGQYTGNRLSIREVI